jgi:hypothetical protein
MASIKLSVTCGKRLAAKYDAQALDKVRKAIEAWTAADKARGFQTIHVELDDPVAMRSLGVSALTGRATPGKVKRKLDALVARHSPDYVVLIGSADVIPMFVVPNPSAHGDDEPTVSTDNPYACSKRFYVGRLSSYLVPDRVLGRIPDLPGSSDPSWLTKYLTAVAAYKPLPASRYAGNLSICVKPWKNAGKRCMQHIGRDPRELMISPPTRAGSAKLKARHAKRLHMIKCHGGGLDSHFYGQRGQNYPDALTSKSLVGRTRRATVVGAMCCFGADVYDPADPAALQPGEPSIPSVYLKQGAHGFLGATSTAWVGDEAMMDADWIVSGFLKGVLGGSSMGRATLESKQDFMHWIQKQGYEPGTDQEKTLLQFVLLGDPAIHPVRRAAPISAGLPAGLPAITQPAGSASMARRQRRVARHQIGEMIRSALAERSDVRGRRVPKGVQAMARAYVKAGGSGFKFRLERPKIHRIVRKLEAVELSTAGRARSSGGAVMAAAPSRMQREIRQYSWAAQRKAGPVREIRMVSIQADRAGTPIRAEVVISA